MEYNHQTVNPKNDINEIKYIIKLLVKAANPSTVYAAIKHIIKILNKERLVC